MPDFDMGLVVAAHRNKALGTKKSGDFIPFEVPLCAAWWRGDIVLGPTEVEPGEVPLNLS
jgi:hypothetical protein